MALSSFRLLLAETPAPAAGAATPAGSTAAQPPGAIGYLFPLLIAGAFYFLFFAPQMKKQKEHGKMLAALQAGDEIITTGGIVGVITSVKEDRFIVRIAENTKVEVGKSFVQTVVKSQAADKK